MGLLPRRLVDAGNLALEGLEAELVTAETELGEDTWIRQLSVIAKGTFVRMVGGEKWEGPWGRQREGGSWIP